MTLHWSLLCVVTKACEAKIAVKQKIVYVKAELHEDRDVASILKVSSHLANK